MKKLLLLILPLTAFSEEYKVEESHEEVPHVIVRKQEGFIGFRIQNQKARVRKSGKDEKNSKRNR